MSYLSLIELRQGRLEEAEAIVRYAMEYTMASRGKGNWSTYASMENLALIYRAQKRHEEAIELKTRVVGILKRELGQDDPETLETIKELDEWRSWEQTHDDREREKPRIVGEMNDDHKHTDDGPVAKKDNQDQEKPEMPGVKNDDNIQPEK